MVMNPWLSQYPPEIPHHLEYPRIPLYQILVDSASLFPDHEAVYFMGKRVTYKELLRLSYRFAHLLRSLGVKKGDRVAIMLPNTPQYIFCFYGTLMAGGVVVQTNPLYVEREVVNQMNDAEAKVIVALDQHYPMLSGVKEKTSLQYILLTGIKDFLPFPKNLLYPWVQKRSGKPLPEIPYDQTYRSLTAEMKAVTDRPIHAQIDPTEDLALLQYTGGTTGIPKGVMLTHHNLVVNALQAKAWNYKTQPGKEKMVAALPFFHVYGMTAALNFGLLIGASILTVPRFNPLEILKLIHQEKATLFPGAPTMYIALINHPEIKRYDLSSIEACLSGSAPLPVEVQTRFEELTGGKLVEGYGLSETSPVTHANLIYGKRVKGSIGLPWPDTEAKIVGLGSGEDLPPGEVGELAVRGPQVMKGYWRKPEDTEKAFLDGWLLTGDVGYMDEEGFFYIVDRKKDMIIAGGYNIYPREVEEVLFTHPAVKEAAVVGVPDPYRGETVKAFVVLKEGASLGEEELDRFCRQKLAAYKVPRLYEFRSELPKTMVGKVLRRVLAEEERKKLKEEKV
ncbi:long-chain-fatty-acid--CoA ligase [Thermicanus aegyptius]|uniref:long-chain-fatty-acid--CoA ligase n=1 Tax=Thermicanus aegyptius TaxID=94009 RepID=UPI00048D7B07|nr:long-chain fatty acid--CoA ligase [Thermicanus aegyptius]